MTLEDLLSQVDKEFPDSLDRLLSLLKIPSISTDPQYKVDCRNAAEWLKSDLDSIGFSAKVRDTEGHPMVVAHGEPSESTILFYGHYDVQPVDPFEKWDHPPFEPRIVTENGQKAIHARGASDDKGQLMTFIEACRVWKEVTGSPPTGISILLEGEEESGSPSLVPFLKQNSEELKADLAFICDTGLFESKIPAIITQLRGLMGIEFEITGPSIDLHSGMYGGLAVNPIQILGNIISDLFDFQGRIAIENFYDGVDELDPSQKTQWNNLNFDQHNFLGEIGLQSPIGEIDRTPLEKLWSRPTCEINGINGGYTGDGFKTVIPSKASAKVSCRLVGNQDPQLIRDNFCSFVKSRIPSDCSVKFTYHGLAAACQMPTDKPIFEIVKNALTEEWQREAVYAGCGGSIPIAGYFQEILGMDSLLTGFGKDNDNIHSPNEKYDFESFYRGIRSWVRVLYNSKN